MGHLDIPAEMIPTKPNLVNANIGRCEVKSMLFLMSPLN
jgi:hypothetical protein